MTPDILVWRGCLCTVCVQCVYVGVSALITGITARQTGLWFAATTLHMLVSKEKELGHSDNLLTHEADLLQVTS